MGGTKWNESSSSTEVLKPRMPSMITEYLEDHMARKQIGLGELAVLAATVENLVHSYGVELLRMAYIAHNLPMHEALGNESEEDLVIRTFMLFYTMPWTQEVWNTSKYVRAHL